MLLAVCAARASAGSCSAFCPPAPPGSFLQSCSRSRQSLACIVARCASCPSSGLGLVLIEFQDIPVVSSLSMYIWMAALTSSLLTSTPKEMVKKKPQNVHFIQVKKNLFLSWMVATVWFSLIEQCPCFQQRAFIRMIYKSFQLKRKERICNLWCYFFSFIMFLQYGWMHF